MPVQLDGLLLLDKPEGPTSHDLVAAVRRVSGIRRVGHTGTLDPLATGLLLLVLGRATRLARFLPQGPKCYSGILRLGQSSPTDDIQGEIREHRDVALPEPRVVLETARGLLGRQMQIPPVYSAKKIGGQRLHRLAREGTETRVPAVQVEVHRFELAAGEAAGEYRFVAEVSSGTYIRGLARDLGDLLGCGGLLVELRRTAIGSLTLDRALPWPLPDQTFPERDSLLQAVLPMEQLPLGLPGRQLDTDDEVSRFVLGGQVSGGPDGFEAGDLVRVLAPDGRLLGIAESGGQGLQPRVVLAPPDGPSAVPPRFTGH